MYRFRYAFSVTISFMIVQPIYFDLHVLLLIQQLILLAFSTVQILVSPHCITRMLAYIFPVVFHIEFENIFPENFLSETDGKI